MRTPERRFSPAQSYVLAIVVTVAAIGLRWILDRWLGEERPFVTLFAAVAVVALFGGWRAGAVASVLGYLACDFLFIAPRGEIAWHTVSQVVGFGAAMVSCAVIVAFGDAVRRAQAQTRAQRELFRTTLASIGDAVVTTDLQGRVVSLNAVGEELTGWTQAEAAGRPLADVFRIVNEQTNETVQNPAARVLSEGVVVGLANHTILIAKDGTRRPIDDSAAPIRDDDGELTGCVLVFRDVTERRAAEEVVQKSERDLRDFFDNAAVGLHWAGPDGTILRANDAELDMLGYTRDEYVGRNIVDFHVDRANIEDILRRLAAGETLVNRPSQMRRKDGSIRHVLLSSNVAWESGKFLHTRCFTRDVTEQSLAEEALRRSRETEAARRADFEALVDAAPAAIWIAHDPECRRISGNPAAARLMRMPHHANMSKSAPNDEVPQHVEVYRDGVRLAPDELPMQVAARTGRATPTEELELVFADGTSSFEFGKAVPLFDAEGRVRGAVAVFVDITDRKRAEEALREVDRRKDEFLATLAHELRNPLAPVRNSLEVMKRAGGDAQIVAQAQETMNRQVEQMERLIDDLLDISRVTRNRLELRKQRVELASVLNTAIEASRPLAQACEHRLVVHLPPEAVYLDGDPTRLAQVFGNLLNNACKYTNPGGRIELTAERRGDEVVVAVADDGIGIAPEFLPRVFEMFTQADRTLEKSHGGLGIGLTLVKQLVEMHGGRVEASSDGPGRGSLFRVHLPVAANAVDARPAPSDAARPSTRARRILVVDDNKDSAESLAMLLQLNGHATDVAHDGIEAIEAATRFQPEVVLLDIGLPRLNGLDVCRRLREESWGKRAVIIALSGWGQESDRQKSKDAGFDAHMVKPLDHAALATLLASAAERQAR